MLPEIAQICLLLALAIAISQGFIGLLGSARHCQLMRSASYLQWWLIAIAYGILTHAFIYHDFSILYVANHSNLVQPLLYRISGVWGAHEGSLLLWVLIQATWSALVSRFSSTLPRELLTKVLAVLGLINAGFLSFMLFTSNPFVRLLPAAADGRELNPLLQDPGLAIHPPMLYVGYVGFSVVFAFAIAALINGKLDAQWARWARPWTSAAWVFLTCGITLGSWWAYYELGWGGWWFWDPVENASFMPWLVGTALIHSLAVTEKRGAFIAWTVLLAIFTFSLSLLGTFLVRSGILTSVHAFASDPERGLFILIFLSIIIGGSLLLYAIRGTTIRSTVGFSMFSRESSLLMNNVFLVITAFMVLLGTLFPLAIEAFGQGKISVGAPYFDVMFIALTAPLALLVGIGAISRWKKDTLQRFTSTAKKLAIGSLVISAIITFYLSTQTTNSFSITAWAGLTLALWVALWTLAGIWERNKHQQSFSLRHHPIGFWGMSIAHFGIAIFIVGITHVNTYSEEKNIVMSPGDTHQIGDYLFSFDGVRRVKEHNYLADEGLFSIQRHDTIITKLAPQKRFYSSGGNPMTEAAIDSSVFRDLYVSLGEQLTDKQGKKTPQWTVRIYYKAYVVCIWLGGFIMALGGLLAIFDRRYRRTTKSSPSTYAGART